MSWPGTMVAYESHLSNHMKASMYAWLKDAQQALFPATCVLCGDAVSTDLDLCGGCRADLPRIEVACRRCGLPLALEGATECGQCLQDPPPWSRTVAPWSYDEPIKHLIHAMKFRQKLTLARVLGVLLAEECARATSRPEVIIPVPLHAGRLRERGYNQALELARPIARQLGLPLDARCSVRVRATQAQSDLPSAQREGNIRGAFALRHPLSAKRVAIVDDVMTTGATLREFAAMLVAAGAEDVQVWVVARALKP